MASKDKPDPVAARGPRPRRLRPTLLDDVEHWAAEGAELGRRERPATPAEQVPLRQLLVSELSHNVAQVRVHFTERMGPVDAARAALQTRLAKSPEPAATPPQQRRRDRERQALEARLAQLDSRRKQINLELAEKTRERKEAAALCDAAWRNANFRTRRIPIELEPTALEIDPELLEPIADPLAS